MGLPCYHPSVLCLTNVNLLCVSRGCERPSAVNSERSGPLFGERTWFNFLPQLTDSTRRIADVPRVVDHLHRFCAAGVTATDSLIASSALLPSGVA